MRRRPNQRRQSSPQQIPFDRSNSHQRIRHRRPAHIQLMARPVRRRRLVAGTVPRGNAVLVEATPEGSWVRCRGTRARLPRQRPVALALSLVVRLRGDRMPSRSGKSDRRRRGNGSPKGDAGRASGSGEDVGSMGGAGGEGGGR